MEDVTLDEGLQAWVLDQQVEKKLISQIYCDGPLAAYYSVGATRAKERLTAIQCGPKGGIYQAFTFWDCANQKDILVIRRWNKDWTFDCLYATRAVQFYNILHIPRVPLGYREWTWDAHARVAFALSVIQSGDPILDGKFLSGFKGDYTKYLPAPLKFN